MSTTIVARESVVFIFPKGDENMLTEASLDRYLPWKEFCEMYNI